MEGAADVLAPEGIAALASFVIRPPRASYSRRDLGEKSFLLDDVRVTRTDIELKNKHGQRLQCSHFEPGNTSEPVPAVVYLHGNGSCRVEAALLLQYVVPAGLSMFAFDFSGSGRSDGEYITLGVREKDDVSAVVEYLVKEKKAPRVALWGHSMGAATALMYAGLCKNSPGVSALVVDSAFQSFDKLADQMVSEMPLPAAVPRKLVLTLGTRAVRRNVRERANFDVYDIDPMSAVKKLNASCAPPAFFVHGMADTVVMPSHSTALYGAYPGKKSVRYLPDLAHDTPRPDEVLEAVFEFLQGALTEGGTHGTRYLVNLKQRGNLCVMAGRYHDAAFLYTAALDALARCAVGCDFASAMQTEGNAVGGEGESSRQRSKFERRRAERSWSGVGDRGAAPKRRWRSRFSRHSSVLQGSLYDADGAVAEVDDDPSGIGSLGGGGTSGASAKSSRAKNLIQGIKARIHARGVRGEERRKSRSGRFSTRNSALGDRRDELRSMGSATELRPVESRKTSTDGVSESFARTPPAKEGRKSFARFRMSKSASVADDKGDVRRTGSSGSEGGAKGEGKQGRGGARGLPRFSQEGWRRRRQARINGDGPQSSSTTVRPKTVVPRSASVDLRVARRSDVSVWMLNGERKAVALALLGNRSLALSKMSDNNGALLDAAQCLRLDARWMRGYLRKAAALRQAGRLEAARDAVADGLAVDPAHKQLLDLLAVIDDALAHQRLSSPKVSLPPAAAETEVLAPGAFNSCGSPVSRAFVAPRDTHTPAFSSA